MYWEAGGLGTGGGFNSIIIIISSNSSSSSSSSNIIITIIIIITTIIIIIITTIIMMIRRRKRSTGVRNPKLFNLVQSAVGQSDWLNFIIMRITYYPTIDIILLYRSTIFIANA